MWEQNYTPVAGSLGISALLAAIPIFVLLILIGVVRKPAWMASLAGLATAAIVAAGVYGMPLDKLFAAVTYGAAFGLWPIGWVVFSAILLYRITLETGKFDMLKDSDWSSHGRPAPAGFADRLRFWRIRGRRRGLRNSSGGRLSHAGGARL